MLNRLLTACTNVTLTKLKSPTPQTQICIVQVQEKIPQRSMTYFQVDMNVITPTPPHPNPKWPRCIFYCYAHHIIHVRSSWHERYYPHPTPNDPYVYSIAGFYMRAWFYKVGLLEGHRNSAGCLKLLWLRSLILLSLDNPLPHCCESSTKNPMVRAWLKLIGLKLGIYRKPWVFSMQYKLVGGFNPSEKY